MNRVVITGMGIYSCIGKNIEEVKESLLQGKSGIHFDQVRHDMGFRSSLTGMVEKPNLKKSVHRNNRKKLAEQGEYAVEATLEAIKNAGLTPESIAENECGILYGNDSSALAVTESVDLIREKKDTTLLGSGAIFKAMNSTVTMTLATIFKLKGINMTVSSACASGSHAIGFGYHLIKSGLQKRIICGGAQEINPYAMGSFDGLSVFSTNPTPHEASRPFDSSRDGLVPSGGAATVILENYDDAIKRGAPILGEVVGFGFSSNGDHISTPNVEGPARALKMSLKDAGLTPNDIDYINAHATSTPVGDLNEAKAINTIFNDKKPWVSSTKSMTGHECWMAGASEIVYSLIMMQNSFIAPNINCLDAGEIDQLIKIAKKTEHSEINTFLSNSFGFGGTNSSLVIKKII